MATLPQKPWVARLRAIRAELGRRADGDAPVLHVSSVDNSGEDRQTAHYLKDVAAWVG